MFARRAAATVMMAKANERMVVDLVLGRKQMPANSLPGLLIDCTSSAVPGAGLSIRANRGIPSLVSVAVVGLTNLVSLPPVSIQGNALLLVIALLLAVGVPLALKHGVASNNFRSWCQHSGQLQSKQAMRFQLRAS